MLTADILESGSDDFESGEDIHDAVGSILAEVAGDEGEDDIIDICNQLMSALKGFVLNIHVDWTINKMTQMVMVLRHLYSTFFYMAYPNIYFLLTEREDRTGEY